MAKPTFRANQFTIQQDQCAQKVSTDGVLFGCWLELSGFQRVLDVGTGTGLLALISAQRNPNVHIDAVEIDPNAAQQALENCAGSPWPDRITVIQADIRTYAVAALYDHIICNPPYYANYLTSPDATTNIAKHSNELLVPELLIAVEELLAPNGRFSCIQPIERATEFMNEAERVGLFPNKRCDVKYTPEKPVKRVLLELSRCTTTIDYQNLTLQATGPFDYSPEYRELIRDVMIGF